MRLGVKMHSLIPGGGIATTFILGLLLLTPLSDGGVATNSPEIEVVLKPKESLVLAITLQPTKTVTVSESYLPWISDHPKFTLLAAGSGGICIERGGYIEDAFLGPVTLQQGVPLAGAIDLEKEFPGLKGYLKITDVHLFWVYEWPSNLNTNKWSSGVISLPKQ